MEAFITYNKLIMVFLYLIQYNTITLKYTNFQNSKIYCIMREMHNLAQKLTITLINLPMLYSFKVIIKHTEELFKF